MKKIIAIACMAFIVNAQAQTLVTIPDANFATYLQGLIPAAMSGSQLNTSSPLVTGMLTLSPQGMAITDLTGVQYFTSLTDLECYSNSLTTLPALPATLITLDCYYNNLTSLPALPASLTWLDCEYNSLTTLPALPNSLTWLGCSNNHLTSLPALPNSLQELGCNNNNLTSLPALPNSLQVLACDNNSLTALPALPNSLQVLACDNNSLTTLPALPDSLTELTCGNNNISCFPVFPASLGGDTDVYVSLNPNPYNCLPNYVLPTMNSYTTTPLCAAGNTNGCAVSTAGIEQYNQNNRANIYPNPNNGNFVIETNGDENQTLQLYDANGRLVLSQTINGKSNIDASSLNAGVYNLSITGSQALLNKRLVIVK